MIRATTPKSRSPRGKSQELGFDDFIQRHPAGAAQVGTVPYLQVPQVVAGGVLHHLVGDALDGFRGLEQWNGDVEPEKIILEIGGVVHQHETPERFRLG